MTDVPPVTPPAIPVVMAAGAEPEPRDLERARFIARAGWRGAERVVLAGDASFRRYDRLRLDRQTAVLMDAPPPHEDVGPFLKVCAHLKALGLSAPTVLAADADTGFVLLEDLGDDLFRVAIDRDPTLETALYASAVDLLADLHDRPGAAALDVPVYGPDVLLTESLLLIDWYWPLALGRTATDAERQGFIAVLEPLLATVGVPQVLVLRDYHAENLLWLPGRRGTARVGVIDFQDALIGHAAYDLVSLLEDARRDVAPDLAEAMVGRYLARRRGLAGDSAAGDADGGAGHTETFRTACAVLGAQRNMKIAGIFARLHLRDGKPRYLDYQPRVWRMIEHDLLHPALHPLAEWLDEHLPWDARGRTTAVPPGPVEGDPA
ncbi:aminoglycoside phosphotransferase [Tistrella bauzanensis]|uniref:Aminoglycoside phosphotransferase n=1 Tax=Tistrella bauzanensis TaxID=657419 RepID=A0ABQ1IC80_9PROT|nr:phosphotransferase [Tistrella bauzanensis]GGB34408.1 aminoglycoside phosphotransferase [Tistrella bauzanensis]